MAVDKFTDVIRNYGQKKGHILFFFVPFCSFFAKDSAIISVSSFSRQAIETFFRFSGLNLIFQMIEARR